MLRRLVLFLHSPSSPLTHARILSSIILFLTAFYPSTSIPEQLTMVAAHTGKAKSVAMQELQTAFVDIMSHEDTLKEKFRAKFNSIVSGRYT